MRNLLIGLYIGGAIGFVAGFLHLRWYLLTENANQVIASTVNPSQVSF